MNNDSPWDAGLITTPLKEYIDQLINKDLKILIPGAGNGHEFDYLVANGFKNVFVVDIASAPLEKIRTKHPELTHQVLEEDFFEHSDQYDLILEQTFFCALDPGLRKNYAKKMHELLKPSGKLSGLLFQFPLTEAGPPFGGSIEEYKELFAQYFLFKTFETANNSIKPRLGRELFIIFEKNNNTHEKYYSESSRN
jgi:thiopurine S-methyltransferase